MSNTLPYGDPDKLESSEWSRASRASLDRLSASGSVVDLNTGSVDDLCSVPGIGPTLAQRIISFRAEHGPFSDASELARVPRIGSRILARVSDRVSTCGRAMDTPLPISLGSFGSPRPANVTVESTNPEVPPPSVSVETADKAKGPAADSLVRIERRHRVGLAAVCVLASMTGLFGGYCLSQSVGVKPPASSVAVAAQTEAEHQEIRTELERQAADISSTTAAVAKVAARQSVFEAETHAEQAKVAQDVTDLAERTKRAQARTDAKVYQLGEAMKLIDWATSGGYATKATAGL